ncbi:hypothetical protein AVEN_168647-1 [Araneus ventricosus]|uniref:Uncharacterized protein n=1 Tax=Araneus ventricosus TaxID=182803 RepID=A0A4Y2JBH9_ARAVE|nr:hypothetical protein AVEN_168647-1 [Araneus ventricosus]
MKQLITCNSCSKNVNCLTLMALLFLTYSLKPGLSEGNDGGSLPTWMVVFPSPQPCYSLHLEGAEGCGGKGYVDPSVLFSKLLILRTASSQQPIASETGLSLWLAFLAL